jgi:Short C-terminal domain
MRRGMRGRPMPRRMGRPGLMGTVARTAVVAGTATAVAGGVHRHQEQKTADQQTADQQTADAQQQQVPQPSAPQAVPQPSAPAEDDRLAKIKELGQMRDQGLLTDQEFASEKARVLAT